MPPKAASKRKRKQRSSAAEEPLGAPTEGLANCAECSPQYSAYGGGDDDSSSGAEVCAVTAEGRVRPQVRRRRISSNETMVGDDSDGGEATDLEGDVERALQQQLQRGIQLREMLARQIGGLVKPSGAVSCVQATQFLEETELTDSQRREIFFKHMKHFMWYKEFIRSSRPIVSFDMKPEVPSCPVKCVELLRFCASLPCVWRYILHELKRVEGKSTEPVSPVMPDIVFSATQLISLFRECLASVNGICALLYLACPACRALPLPDQAQVHLLHVLLQTGRVLEKRLFAVNCSDVVYDAISQIDVEVRSRFGGGSCCHSQAHSYLFLLLSYTRGYPCAVTASLKVLHDVTFSQAFESALSPYSEKNVGGSGEGNDALLSFNRFESLMKEVEESATVWAEGSSKFVFILQSTTGACSCSSGDEKLVWRELMGALFLLHRVVSESTMETFLLESKEDRITELHQQSLLTGLITPSHIPGGSCNNDGVPGSNSASGGVGEESQRVYGIAGRTYRQCLHDEQRVSESSNAQAMIERITRDASANIRFDIRAAEEEFPHEYIKAHLKPHQLESFAYMLERETNGLARYVELRGCFREKPGPPSASGKSEAEGRGKWSLFYSSLTSECFFCSSDSLSARFASQRLRCGFLCDEVGLGKTLVVLSLCAAMRKRAIESEGAEEHCAEHGFGGDNVECGTGRENVGCGEPAALWRTFRLHDSSSHWFNLVHNALDGKPPPTCLPRLKPLPHTTLVVVPVSLMAQWVAEIDRFYPSARYIIFHGPRRRQYTYEDFYSADFVITSYETISAHLRVEACALFRLMKMALPEMERRDISLVEWDAFLSTYDASRAQPSSPPPLPDRTKESVGTPNAVFELVDRARRRVLAETRLPVRESTRRFVERYRREFRRFLQNDAIYLTDLVFERIVLDECQKCPKTSLLHYLQADRRWVVSGTPINNNNADSLQPLFRFLWGELDSSCLPRPPRSFECQSKFESKLAVFAANAFRKSRGMACYALNSSRALGRPESSNGGGENVLGNPAVRGKFCLCRACSPFTYRTAYPKSPVLTVNDELYEEVSSLTDEKFASPEVDSAFYLSWRFAVPLTYMMVRHEKNEEVQRALDLTPVTEVFVEVQLTEPEKFVYDYAEGVVSENVSRLERQGLLGHFSANLQNWISLLVRVALHPSISFIDVQEGAELLRVQSREGGVEAAEKAMSSIVNVTAAEALAYVTHARSTITSVRGSRDRGVARSLISPETTMEVLRKMLLNPPEIPMCSICLGDMLEPTLLSCFHLFCKECLLQVIEVSGVQSNGTRARCPHCRDPQSMREEMRVITLESADISTMEMLQQGVSGVEGPASLLDCLQQCVDSVGLGSRMTRLMQLLEEIWGRNPDDIVLVFSKVPAFLRMAETAMRAAGYQNVYVVDNHVSLARRRKIFAQLHADAAAAVGAKQLDASGLSSGTRTKQVLFLSSRVAASGLNLVFANHLIFAEPASNPAQHQQAIGRIDRCGQRKKTHVYVMYARNTIEERIKERMSTLLRGIRQGSGPLPGEMRGVGAGPWCGLSEPAALLRPQKG